MAKRVSCVGYGRPCPNHAWWYHDRSGPARKRCAFCHERRRWLEPEHTTSCVDCGAPLSQPATGRPRIRCEECSPRVARVSPQMRLFAEGVGA